MLFIWMVGSRHHVRGLLLHGVLHRAPQRIRRVHHVGVAEEEPLAGSRFSRLPHGMRLAQPARGQLAHVHHRQAFAEFDLQAIQDRAGRVFGAVIDHHQFIVRVVDGKQRAHRGFDHLLLIARRNNDADARQPASGRNRILRLAQVGNPAHTPARRLGVIEPDRAQRYARDEIQRMPGAHACSPCGSCGA